jgi:hypothetical protein
LIVQTQLGHKVNEIYPVYQFKKPEDLDLFIRMVRERELLEKFQPEWVYLNDKKKDSIARNKVVRLWKKDGVPLSGSGLLPRAKVTLTFLNTSGKQQELDLACYQLAKLSKNKKAVELEEKSGPSDNSKPSRITFEFLKKESRLLFKCDFQTTLYKS